MRRRQHHSQQRDDKTGVNAPKAQKKRPPLCAQAVKAVKELLGQIAKAHVGALKILIQRAQAGHAAFMHEPKAQGGAHKPCHTGCQPHH